MLNFKEFLFSLKGKAEVSASYMKDDHPGDHENNAIYKYNSTCSDASRNRCRNAPIPSINP